MPTALRRGWTTGACATAATAAAYAALRTGTFPDPVTIDLPGGKRPAFALAVQRLEQEAATAGVVKDAGDDPDVTHGALVLATVRHGARGSGVEFRAGPGVGTVTLPGLPVPVGEPAINPVPRRMMREAVGDARRCKRLPRRASPTASRIICRGTGLIAGSPTGSGSPGRSPCRRPDRRGSHPGAGRAPAHGRETSAPWVTSGSSPASLTMPAVAAPARAARPRARRPAAGRRAGRSHRIREPAGEQRGVGGGRRCGRAGAGRPAAAQGGWRIS